MEVKNAEQMFNDLRLDYDGTKFSKNKGFATIEYDNMGDVVRPYNSKYAPTYGPPNTLTGMTGSSGKIIPEFCIEDRISLNNGAILRIYDKEGNVEIAYRLKSNIWEEIK